MLVQARQLGALRAFRLRRNRHRRRHRLLYLHRIRFGLDRRRGIAQSAKRLALRHHHVADRLHAALRRRRGRAARHDEVHDLRLRRSRRSARGLRDEVSRRAPVLPLGDRDRRADGHDLFAARVSVRPGAHLVRHVARRPVAQAVLRGASEISRRRTGPPGSPVSPSEFPPASSTSEMPPTSPTSGRCSPSFWFRWE